MPTGKPVGGKFLQKLYCADSRFPDSKVILRVEVEMVVVAVGWKIQLSPDFWVYVTLDGRL